MGAGIRQPVTAFVGDGSTYAPARARVHADPSGRRRRPGPGGEAAAYVAEVVSDLLASGFVRAELARAGQDPDLALDR